MPFQPPSVAPIGEAHTFSGAQNSFPPPRGNFVGLAPETKLQPFKLNIQILEISEVFINPYFILSCNLHTEQYLELLLGITSPDHL